MRIDTRVILIALVIFNVVAIGMGEIQRRALIERALSPQTDFRMMANDWSNQQAELLKRTAAELEEIAARVNKIQIQVARTADANTQVQEIYDRVVAMQKTLEASKQSQPAQ